MIQFPLFWIESTDECEYPRYGDVTRQINSLHNSYLF